MHKIKNIYLKTKNMFKTKPYFLKKYRNIKN